MVHISPFKGVRPKQEVAEAVASPPYDVLSSEEARALAKDNPKSFLHVVKPEIDLEPEIDIYDQRVYQKGAENLNRLIKSDILIQEARPKYYIYKLKMGEREQVGLVACASIDDYFEGRIKKHEHTRAKKENDRMTHVDALDANTGPVFLTYRTEGDIQELIEQCMAADPLYDFESDDGIRHTFYSVDDESMIARLTNAFKNVDVLYVADGHHRAASGAKVGHKRRTEHPDYNGDEPFNTFLVVIFPHEQLHIMDYNRVVRDLNGRSKSEFCAQVKEKFEVQEYASDESYRPPMPHHFGMYIDGKWYALKAKAGTFDDSDPVEVLDVSILQNNLLEPILGIENPREDNRIDFVGGIRGLGELENLVDSGEYKLAFAMFPTSIEQLMKVADAGKVMPPKSTWFEPKLRSGVIVHLL